MESDGDGGKFIRVRGRSAEEQAIKPSTKGEGAMIVIDIGERSSWHSDAAHADDLPGDPSSTGKA